MKKIIILSLTFTLFNLSYSEIEESQGVEEIEVVEEQPVTGNSIFFTNSDQIKIEIKDHSNDFKRFNKTTENSTEKTENQSSEDKETDKDGEDKGTENKK